MKAQHLKVKNIGLIEDSTIQLNKPLILLYGQVRQGKTTFLKAVQWVFGGPFPQDIIRHGEKEASIELGLDGGCIIREFYKAKTGETKARDVQFVRAGKPVPKPVTEIQRFLNPFLLNQNFLLDKNEAERKAYFAELFEVDTTDLDTEAFNNERKASNLRAEIKAYGEIDTTPVTKPDVTSLRAKLHDSKSAYEAVLKAHEDEVAKIDANYNQALADVALANQGISKTNNEISLQHEKLKLVQDNVASLEKRLSEAKALEKTIRDTIKLNPVQKLLDNPAPPTKPERPIPPKDIWELEEKISAAAAQQVRFEHHEQNLKRADEKKSKEAEVSKLEARGREIKREKQAKLSTVTKDCGIRELSFDETGALVFEGTTAGMLSTSQIMRLSSQLSELYPEGFGIELLDRGESLGTSIFEFVDRAKAEKKTILASIVGERPAKKVPDDVGVFVVEGGKATESKD